MAPVRIAILAACALAASAVLATVAIRTGRNPVRDVDRGAIARHRPGAVDELILDTIPPTRAVRLISLEGRVAHGAGDGAVVVDGSGTVVAFDPRLKPRYPALGLTAREWISAAPAPDAGWWLVDESGHAFVAKEGRPPLELPRPAFRFSTVASDSRGGAAVLVRSARRFSYDVDTAPAPLAIRLDAKGFRVGKLGAAGIPAHIFLRDLANAGDAAVFGDTVAIASFIRDEVVAFTGRGDTLWRLSRNLGHGTGDPRFVVRDGHVAVDYSPVNLGITKGPDGMLYVLSTPERTTSATRLDVIDPSRGVVVRSVRIESGLPTLAADSTGRVYRLDAARLLTGVIPSRRDPGPPFRLPTSDADTVSSDAMRGRVTLVSVWASWCGPCREEMPALDSLRRGIGDASFRFLALNDDVNRGSAIRFLESGAFDFPTAFGDGLLRDRFGIPGLPATFLIDRDGRVVKRWLGFGGLAQLTEIRALVASELLRTEADPTGHHHGGQ